MRPAPLPCCCSHHAFSTGMWAAELTVRRFVDLARTKSMMCHALAR
ncbi:hypothetical protein [Microlunatus phosphovorus]|nr:hypothetical protein [Microlunatus phosphovorus]